MNSIQLASQINTSFFRLLRIARLQYRGLFLWNTRVAIISNALISPILIVVTYSFIVNQIHNVSRGSVLIGVGIVAGGSTAAGAMLQSAANDVEFGTRNARRMATLPLPLQDLIAMIGFMPIVALTITSSTITAFALHGAMPYSRIGWIILAVAISAISLIFFSSVVGLSKVIRDDWVSGVLFVNGIVLAGSGAIIPRSTLPFGLNWLSHLIPTSNILPAVRSLLDNTYSASHFLRHLGFETCLIFGYMLIFLFFSIQRRVEE